jgi:membrane-associated protein
MEILHSLVHLLQQLKEIVLHLDVHLNEWITLFGPGFYGLMALILFAETGLVVTPFLPGDSLLFALGALTATENAYLQLSLLVPVLLVAVFLGDNLNYAVGRFAGKRLFSNPRSKVFRKEYLDRTHAFYEKHGGKMVVIARFAPILRTFSPFVGGMAGMRYRTFLLFSVGGALLWVLSFLGAGHFFGNLPAVKRNFHVVILAIVLISLIPAVLEAWKARSEMQARA